MHHRKHRIPKLCSEHVLRNQNKCWLMGNISCQSLWERSPAQSLSGAHCLGSVHATAATVEAATAAAWAVRGAVANPSGRAVAAASMARAAGCLGCNGLTTNGLGTGGNDHEGEHGFKFACDCWIKPVRSTQLA
mmetsp:Transcript_55014/g.98055  ORF Transcript_55014/g.98055 Transcript_55014/m.98055 type:complete len:134 (-) Transcript_55014:22-423(-)